MYVNLKAASENFQGASRTIQPVTLVGGRAASCLDLDIVAERLPGQPLSYRLQDSTTSRILFQISWNDLEDRLKRAMLAYFYEDYARIKQHLVFRKVYGYATRPVSYLKNGALVQVECGTFPCMTCGIILPDHLITIDHHKPQQGGEALALLKVFRACGWTLKGPWGVLGRTYQEHAGQSWIDLATAIMDTSRWPGIQPGVSTVHDLDYEDRHTLNSEGILIHSVLVWSGDIARVTQNCMDSLLNLKPLCLSCNASKGKKILGEHTPDTDDDA